MSEVDINIVARNLTSGAFLGAARNMSAFKGQVLKHQMALRMAGQDMRLLGRSMMRYISLPLIAAGAVSVKFAYDYEQSMMRVASLTESSAADMKLYNKAVLDMSAETAKPVQELAEGLYFISSAGFTGKTALKMLGEAARSSSAGMGLVKDNADAMTSAIHAWGIANLSAKEANDVLVQSVISGKMEPAELARSLGRVIAPAEQAGLKFWEVGAAVASLSRVGLSARMSTFSLRSLFMSLVKPSEGATKALKKFGLDSFKVFTDLKTKGLFPVLMEISKAVKSRGGTMKDFAAIFNANSLNAFLALTGKSAGRVRQVFSALENSSGRARKAFETAMKSDSAKLRQAWYTLTAALTKLGIVLMPIVTKMVGYFNQLIKWFSGLSKGTQEWILKLMLLAIVLGPVIAALGSFIQMLPTLVRVGALLLGPLKGISTGILGVGVAAEGAAPKMGLFTRGLMAFATSGLALNPVFDAIVIGAAVATFAVARLIQESKKTHYDVYKKSAELTAGDKSLQAWANRRLGGTLVVKDGQILWQPKVKVDIDKKLPPHGVLANWIRTEAARTHAAEAEALKQRQIDVTKGQLEFFKNNIVALENMRRMMKGGEAAWQKTSFPTQLLFAQDKVKQLTGEYDKLTGAIDRVRTRGQRAIITSQLTDMKVSLVKTRAEYKRLSSIPEKDRTIRVIAATEAARGKIAALRWNIKNFTRQNFRVIIQARIEKEQSKVNKMRTTLRQLNREKVTPQITADKKKLVAEIEKSQKKINSLKQKNKPKLDVLDIATGKLQTIKQAFDLIPTYKKITIETVTKGPDHALGGVFAIPHIARIAEKGPEAIIPLTDPVRATAVMRQAGLLGRSPVPPARLPTAGISGESGVHYHSHLELPQGLIVSDPDKFTRGISPWMRRNMELAEGRRERGRAGF